MNEMSSVVESATLGGGKQDREISAQVRIANEPAGFFGRLNEWVSEGCSSILVKETRQALKSRQFIWTYIVLLVCVGGWVLLGLTFNRQYYAAGSELLVGFWFILGFPLGLIIPYSAYRSLAREFEDGTIHLISITTMKPYQIVVGKFGSAMLQLMIYLSVLAPCIMFTYMLRGINFWVLIMGLAISVGGSIFLTIVGLFLAGAFRSRAMSIGVSVLFVLALGWLYWLWCMAAIEFTTYGVMNYWEPGMTLAVYCVVAFFVSMAAILMMTSAAQISFPSNNRSTGIRGAMLVQQTLFLAAAVALLPMILPWVGDYTLVMMFIAAHYWLIMGFLMVGESSPMSRRVQRSLPQTLATRSMFSLMMPGAGRGFLFAVANAWACFLTLVAAGCFYRFLMPETEYIEAVTRYAGRLKQPPGIFQEVIGPCLINGLFTTYFLAVAYMAMQWFLRKSKREWSTGVGPTISLVFGVLFVAVLSVGTLIIHLSLFLDGPDFSDSPILVANWYWATIEFSKGTPHAFWFALFAVQAFVVIAFAFMVASRELLHKRIAIPERVAIDIESRKKIKTLPKGESIDEIFGELRPESKAAPGNSS